MSNRLSRMVKLIHKMPQGIQPFLLTKLFCSQVKYAATSNIKLLSVTNTQAELKIENRKKVRNHIGGVHAVAAALLAESATGIVFGVNVPESSIPLLKSMKIEYKRRMEGSLSAKAILTSVDCEMIANQEKGEIMVPVEITDESGLPPIICSMEWAWIQKKPKKSNE